MTNVAVFHHRFKHMGGAERVANALADTLNADLYTLYVSEECRESTDARPVKQNKYTRPVVGRFFRRIAVENVARSIDAEHVRLDQYDVVITSGDYAHFYLPTDDQTHIHYLHTPNRDFYIPAEYEALTSGPLQSIKTLYFQWLRGRDLDHARHVDRWMANSSFVKARCKRFYDATEESVNVVSPPINWTELGPAKTDRADYWVTVGRLVPAKRVGLLVDAIADLGERLIVAGSGPELEPLQEQAPKSVDFVGYVSDERKRELLRNASGFLFAGELECFGMSVAEALAAGTPVVSVGEGNMTNLVNENNGIIVDSTANAFREGINMANDRTWDYKAIRRAARTYSRERFAERVRATVSEEREL